jgi:3-oxoadipate enol-lactonase
MAAAFYHKAPDRRKRDFSRVAAQLPLSHVLERRDKIEDMKQISISDTKLWCDDRGNGAPILLVHGFPLDHSMWNRLELPGRIIAPDLRGFGRSPARGEVVTMERFADDLAELLDALGIAEPVVFCGLSMGGYVALQFWKKYAARLRGLILCDTRAAADLAEAAAARLATADRVLREGSAPLVEAMLPRLFAETTRRKRPEVIESLRRVMMTADPRGIAAAARGMAERPDMTGALKQIRCPALAIVGAEDVSSPPAEMRAMAATIPGAAMVEIPEAGHLAPLENPTAVGAAIAAFISSLS